MPTLKLPRALPGPAEPPAPPSPPALLLGRREFLKGLGALLAALAAAVTGVRRAYAAARGRFFTGHEFATLAALCDRVIPPDHDPGARAGRGPLHRAHADPLRPPRAAPLRPRP